MGRPLEFLLWLRLCDTLNGSDLHNLYLRWFQLFQISIGEALEDCVVSKKTEEVGGMEGVTTPSLVPNADELDRQHSDGGMEFYLTDEKGTVKNSKISMNEPLAINGELRPLLVLVCWSEKQIKKCLEAFLQEESLGLEDMWLIWCQ